MWIDERGSVILGRTECLRLLALGATQQLHGHLGFIAKGAPFVLPVNYAVAGRDVVLRIGDGLFDQVANCLVAFQVDGVGADDAADPLAGRPWSVLIRGLASELSETDSGVRAPTPLVSDPGSRRLRIRADAVSGRKLGPAAAASQSESAA